MKFRADKNLFPWKSKEKNITVLKIDLLKEGDAVKTVVLLTWQKSKIDPAWLQSPGYYRFNVFVFIIYE